LLFKYIDEIVFFKNERLIYLSSNITIFEKLHEGHMQIK